MSTRQNYLLAGVGGRAAFEFATEIKAKRPRVERVTGGRMNPTEICGHEKGQY